MRRCGQSLLEGAARGSGARLSAAAHLVRLAECVVARSCAAVLRGVDASGPRAHLHHNTALNAAHPERLPRALHTLEPGRVCEVASAVRVNAQHLPRVPFSAATANAALSRARAPHGDTPGEPAPAWHPARCQGRCTHHPGRSCAWPQPRPSTRRYDACTRALHSVRKPGGELWQRAAS